MKKPKIVGLTGGIGSGKSTCAEVFYLLGTPIYYADKRAKELYTESASLKRAVIDLLGEGAYSNGELDRAFVAEQVFADGAKLKALERLVHPEVKKDFRAWLALQNAPYVVREAAILIESGSHKDCDHIVAVEVDQEVALERTMLRDGSNKEAVLARMAKQFSNAERAQHADFVIDNNGQELVIPQVERIHTLLMEN